MAVSTAVSAVAEGSEDQFQIGDTSYYDDYGNVVQEDGFKYHSYGEPTILTLYSLGTITSDSPVTILSDQFTSEEIPNYVAVSIYFIPSNSNAPFIDILDSDGNRKGPRILCSHGGNVWSSIGFFSRDQLKKGLSVQFTDTSGNGLDWVKPANIIMLEVRRAYCYEKKAVITEANGVLDELSIRSISSESLSEYPISQYTSDDEWFEWIYYGRTKIEIHCEIIEADPSLSVNYGNHSSVVDFDFDFDGDELCYQEILNEEIKKNGITFKGHGVKINSVEVWVITEREEPPVVEGYQSAGSSIQDVPVDTVVTQKTAVADGRYGERFVKKVAASDVVGKTKATFTLSNGTVTKTVSTTKYNTALTVDGETISAGSGYVFLVYTLSGIPENVNVTVTGVTLE